MSTPTLDCIINSQARDKKGLLQDLLSQGTQPLPLLFNPDGEVVRIRNVIPVRGDSGFDEWQSISLTGASIRVAIERPSPVPTIYAYTDAFALDATEDVENAWLGNLNLSTDPLAALFSATTEDTISDLFFTVQIQFPDEAPHTILRMPVSIARTAVNMSELVPVAAPGYPAPADVVVRSLFGDASYTPSAAGNVQLLPGLQQTFRIIAGAGAGAFTYALVLKTDNAKSFCLVDGYIELPASTNPTIEIREGAVDGTLLHTVAGNAIAARYQNVRFAFDGTHFKKHFSGDIV